MPLKGAIRDIYYLLSVPQTVSNTHTHVVRAQSCANHKQHIKRLSRVKCHVPSGTKGQMFQSGTDSTISWTSWTTCEVAVLRAYLDGIAALLFSHSVGFTSPVLVAQSFAGIAVLIIWKHHAHTNNIHWTNNNSNNNNNNNNNNRIPCQNSRFFTISSLHHKLSPTRTLNWPGRNHVQITSAHHAQHVMLRVKWYEGAAQLLSLTEFKSHLFELYFIGWTINQWLFCVSHCLYSLKMSYNVQWVFSV